MTGSSFYNVLEGARLSQTQRDPIDAGVVAHFRGPLVSHLSALFIVLLFVSIPYARLATAYFVGYDDFKEVYRAAFEDTREPSRILTTKHFSSAKYRPLNRGMNFISYHLGQGNPLAFRMRNICFHLLNCAILFFLGVLLFDSVPIGALGAVLFGLNPLAHQAVAGAVMTNTAAASLALIATLLGLLSYRAREHNCRWLVLSITAVWIGMFIYEADIAVLGVIVLYGVLDLLFLRRLRVRKSWVWLLVLLSMVVVVSMLGTRAVMLQGVHQPIAPFVVIARNSVMYATALLLPVDPLLANQWFGTPLVTVVPVNRVTLMIGFGAVCLAFSILLVFTRSIQKQVSRAFVMHCTFLIGAICFSILPLLVFNEHPSETYLYLPVAFAMLLLARILFGLRNARRVAFNVIVVFLLLSFGCATWGRSQRVFCSAAIAQRILSGLPTENWKQGEWHIRLANAPGYALPPRYGLYTYRGLDTIGTGDGIGAVQNALRLQTGNEHGVIVDVFSPGELPQVCNSAELIKGPCFWVYPDGRVTQFSGGLSNDPFETR